MKNKFLLFAMMATLFGVLSACEEDTTKTPIDQKVTIYATLENGREWNQGDEIVINV